MFFGGMPSPLFFYPMSYLVLNYTCYSTSKYTFYLAIVARRVLYFVFSCFVRLRSIYLPSSLVPFAVLHCYYALLSGAKRVGFLESYEVHYRVPLMIKSLGDSN